MKKIKTWINALKVSVGHVQWKHPPFGRYWSVYLYERYLCFLSLQKLLNGIIKSNFSMHKFCDR